MAGRRRRVLVTRDRRSHPNGSATNREQGDRLTTCHARPVEPDASRGARPVRGRLLEVNLVVRDEPNLQLLSHVVSHSRGAWATGTDLLVLEGVPGRPRCSKWVSAQRCAQIPPRGSDQSPLRTIGVSIPRHGSVQREPASGASVWRHTEPGCETRPGDPHEKCGRRIAQRCNARNR
jgi:hypothetical protein